MRGVDSHPAPRADNNLFDEDEEEEDIEEDAGKPGKIISINNLDFNADGIPDFADGFDCPNGGALVAPHTRAVPVDNANSYSLILREEFKAY